MKYLKMVLAVPVGILAIVLMVLETPLCALWLFCVSMTRGAGSGLPDDLTKLRTSHWYVGRLWENLWRNR